MYAGQLELGDVLLSVDGAVTESAKETMKYLKRGPQVLTFVYVTIYRINCNISSGGHQVLTFVVAGRALAGEYTVV